MTKTRCFRLRLAANLFIAAGTLFAFYLMYFRSGGLLQAKGIAAFKYFTVQSNAFGGIMAVVWLILAASGRDGRQEGKEIPRAVTVLKFTAAVCLGLTFVTVMVFLGPLYGYIAMLRNANLFFHLLIPLAAMAEFALLNERDVSVRHCFVAMLPMLAYALGYLTYNLIMGRGENPFQYDWYGFLLWGWGVGVVIFAVIGFLTFGIAALLRKINCMLHK